MSRVLFALLLTSPGTIAQTTIQVPQDQPTIGGAIAAAQDGDTVLVSPGTYLETIDFAGKAIAVRSIAGPFETTIDAQGGFSNNQVVVKFRSGEGRDSLLEGFTITGGYTGAFCETCEGVGINILDSSPTIRDCIVRDNSSLGEAGGILIKDGAPLIQNCIIRGNHTTFDAPGIMINNFTDDWAVIANCVAYNNDTLDPDFVGTIGGYEGSRFLVINTISRSNPNSYGFGIPSSALILHSNSEWVTPGAGNTTADPLWVDPGIGDFRLQAGSPVRDAGSATLPSLRGLPPSLPLSDIFGAPRSAGPALDKGVHELQVGVGYCTGAGGATPCPCANSGLLHQGCANGSGQGALLTGSGSASRAAADFVLHCAGMLPFNSGLFFQGTNVVSGGDGAPFGDGLRCAGGTVVRLQIRQSDAEGRATTNIDIGAAGGAGAGQTLRYQVWYRDATSSPCGSLFNFSNGLQLVWTP